MSPLVLLLLLFMAKGNETPSRREIKGRSAHTWFVVDSKTGASNSPKREVFASATGNDLVIAFVVLPGGVRALTFRSPSSLALPAISDFDVDDRVKPGNL